MFDFQVPEIAEIMPNESRFSFTEKALEAADQITLRQLLETTAIQDRTVDNLLKVISFASANLHHAQDKTTEEKCLHSDLSSLYKAIGQDTMDQVFKRLDFSNDRGAA